MRRTKVPIPEEFCGSFPDHASVSAAISYRSVSEYERTHPEDCFDAAVCKALEHAHYKNPLISSIDILLVPKGERAGHKRIHSMSGPVFEEGEHKALVEEAKRILMDEAFLNQMLDEYAAALCQFR